jgi:alpha-beta hydrolase superfamily lysophospholipase
MFAAGCGGGDASPKPSAEPSSPATQPTGSPAPAPASIGTAKGSVTFETSDGFTLAGRVFGDGPNGVILGHMGSPANSQGDWWTLAEQLAHRGYRVMTFNDRGICPDGAEGCSEGSIDFENAWRDLDAAAGFIRDHGVRKLVVGGGSLGAMAALYLAGRPGQTFDGVMSVSGIQNIDPYVLGQAARRVAPVARRRTRQRSAGPHHAGRESSAGHVPSGRLRVPRPDAGLTR